MGRRARPTNMLGDMRWVLNHAAAEGESAARKEYRAWLAEDRKGFFAKLAQVEAGHRVRMDAKAARVTKAESAAGGAPASAASVDERTESLLELIDRLLDEAQMASLAASAPAPAGQPPTIPRTGQATPG